MVKLRDLNEYITCGLCKGYMVNATAISECMHTFCRGCIVKEFVKNSICPECGISVNPTEPTKTLKSDNQLQDLINKVVPGFAETERAARKQFYASRGEPEEADTVEPIESTFLTPKKRALYRQAGLPVYVMLQHERNIAASTMRIKRYPGHMIRFPSDLTVSHLKEFIRQRLSLGFDTPPGEDVKAQRAWERARLLAIQSAPDVDILYGDYLLDEDVTLGILSKIKHGLIKQAVLALTYRFRGTLKCPVDVAFAADECSLSLTSTSPQNHVTCLSRGKGKSRTTGGMITKPGRVGYTVPVIGAPLAPRHLIINKTTKSPVVRKPVVLKKTSITRKSIIIQHSSKPPNKRVIVPVRQVNNKRVVIHHHHGEVPKRGQENSRPKGAVVKLQRAFKPR